MNKSYEELITIPTFEMRYDYLRLGSIVGRPSAGIDSHCVRMIYHTRMWRDVRRLVLIRDGGCDLGDPDRQIHERPLIHHINPISIFDIESRADCVFDPNNLITTTHNTHNAIHYGDRSLLVTLPPERKKGDTMLWIVS